MSDDLEINDSPVVRLAKGIMWGIAAITFGWWLQYLQFRWPRTRPIVYAVPNALSVARMIAMPFVAFFLAQSIWLGNTSTAWWWFAAMIGLIVLDGIDGPLARELDAVTDVGKALDPLADKIAMLTLTLAYLVLVAKFQGWVAAVLLAGCLIWMFWVEIKLVRITPYTRQLGKLLGDVELRGANNNGKIKFTIQAITFLAVYILMIINPTAIEGPLGLACMMNVARWYGDKSLNQHRDEVRQMENLARRRHLKLPEPESLWQMVRSHLKPGAGDNPESGQSAA